MSDYWITFLTNQMPLVVSLLTAVIGLIVTALKYKKQKYAIAMLEEQNKFLDAQKDSLTAEQIAELKALLEELKK